MRITSSLKKAKKSPSPDISAAIGEVSLTFLRQAVTTLSQPRHFVAERSQNRRSAEWIADQLAGYGYEVDFQGRYRNVVAIPPGSRRESLILVGAHYDSVPGTAGADDNASGVAALLECARVIVKLKTPLPVCFVAFNCEEDGLVGSTDFVKRYIPESSLKISAAHVLEMVGYCSRAKGSQSVPAGLPIVVPSTGNFIGLLGNRDSNHLIDFALERAATYLPGFPAIGLKVFAGIEQYLSVLARSDHYPFWQAGIPAVMWTDTADFRNPNYHLKTDTPDTLDYDFLRSTTQLLLSCLLTND